MATDSSDLYEKLYFHEIEAREKLSARLQIPLALITALAGVLAFISQQILQTAFDLDILCVYVLSALGLILLCVASWHFLQGWSGSTYEFMPRADELAKYKSVLDDFIKQNNLASNPSSELFNQQIDTYYIKCATTNSAVNDVRSARLHSASKFIAYSAAAFFVAVVLLWFTKFNQMPHRGQAATITPRYQGDQANVRHKIKLAPSVPTSSTPTATSAATASNTAPHTTY